MFLDRPFSSTDLSANFARDWPDSRGIWLNGNKTLAAYVNRKDHVLLSIMVQDSDLKKTFETFAQFVKDVSLKAFAFLLLLLLYRNNFFKV